MCASAPIPESDSTTYDVFLSPHVIKVNAFLPRFAAVAIVSPGCAIFIIVILPGHLAISGNGMRIANPMMVHAHPGNDEMQTQTIPTTIGINIPPTPGSIAGTTAFSAPRNYFPPPRKILKTSGERSSRAIVDREYFAVSLVCKLLHCTFTLQRRRQRRNHLESAIDPTVRHGLRSTFSTLPDGR